MASPPKRRRPHCHTCGNPMVGHKRQEGHLICPTASSDSQSTASSSLSSPLTPPHSASETPPRSPSPASTKQALRVELVAVPPTGPWRRRNPNWRDVTPPPRPPSLAGSVVPTVLVDDDGNTIRGSNFESDAGLHDEEDRKLGLPLDGNGVNFEAMSKLTGEPIARVYGAHSKDIPQLSRYAANVGAHAAFIRSPPKYPKAEKGLSATRDRSWWFVMGRSSGMVQDIVDSQQRGMPGEIERNMSVEGPRMVTFLQLLLAGIIGGCAAVYGLSLLA